MFKLQPLKEYGVVLSTDPAIDYQQSDVTEYLRSLDRAALKFLPGMVPTVFYLTPLTVSQQGQALEYLLEQMTLAGKGSTDRDVGVLAKSNIYRLRIAITRIENLEVDGKPYEVVRENGMLPESLLEIMGYGNIRELNDDLDNISQIPFRIGPSAA